MKRLFIPGPLPGLNEIINAKGNAYGGGASAYTKMKKQWCGTIALLAHSQGIKTIGSGHFTYLFRERDKRRDPSNIAAGAVKLIEDGLQTAGLLENDGWKQVLGFSHHFMVDAKHPGCTVFVFSSGLERQEAIDLDDTARSMRA